jgi:hypothetical protein
MSEVDGDTLPVLEEGTEIGAAECIAPVIAQLKPRRRALLPRGSPLTSAR